MKMMVTEDKIHIILDNDTFGYIMPYNVVFRVSRF